MKKLMMGIGRELITPPVGGHLYGYNPDIISQSVNDDLSVTAFYFEQGSVKALMLSITVCEINTCLCTSIREMLQEKTGVPKENIMLCATHTHSAPNVAGTQGWGDVDTEYCDNIFVPKILLAAEKALANMTSVKMRVAEGDSLVGVNRRQMFEDGHIDFGQNPDGPFNKKMTVLSFEDESGKCVANMVHYGCHGTCAGANKEITRDWSGIMIDALENRSGGVTAFFNGTVGDAGPRISNGKTTGNINHVRELGQVAAKDVLEIYGTLGKSEIPVLSAGSDIVKIPLKIRESTKVCERMYEKYKNERINLGALIKGYLENVMRLNAEEKACQEYFEIGQQTVVLGNVVFSGIPFEMFAETGMDVDDGVLNRDVCCVSCCNGFEGYFAPENELCMGGYEVEMFLYGRPQQFCENADRCLSAGMSENINVLLKNGGKRYVQNGK